MWQRIQTLYFALIVAAMAVLAAGNVAIIITPGSDPQGVSYLSKLPYAILIALAGLANLVALFCWGHRSLQIRLAGASAVVLLALQVWIGVDYFKMAADASFVFRWTAVLPFIAFIFELLAMKGVYADELLVRSASRLRSAKRAQQKKK